MLIDKAKFLSEAKGRGLFYFFQGTLWLAFASLTDLLTLGCGLFLAFLGICNILLAYGHLQKIAEKVKSAGYMSVQTDV